MKKIIVASIILLTLSMSALAQTASSVLDNTAYLLKNNGGIEAQFQATNFKGTIVQGTTSGRINVKDNKFKVNTPDGKIWFDGKTQWALYTNSDEVNVSNPTNEEIQSVNPYTFINLYKRGYNSSLKKMQFNNIPCYEITLKAQNPQNKLKELKIIIDKSNYHPYSIHLYQAKNSLLINVSNMKTGFKWNDDFFRFNAKEYPNIEIIDLR